MGKKFGLLLMGMLLMARAWSGEPVVLVLGDSLSAGYGIDVSAGWVALLQERLADRGYPHRVVNASISGETTRGALARLTATLERRRPALVVVELGGNDGLRGISLEEMSGNLAAIVGRIGDFGAVPLLVGVRLPPNYGPVYTDAFRTAFAEVSETLGVAFVPRLLDGVAIEPEMMQADGIHPTAAAQPRMLDNVWAVLQPLLEPAGGGTERPRDGG